MDPITSGAIQPSTQALPKITVNEADMVVNKFGELVTKSDSRSELREMISDDNRHQSTTVENNGLGGTFEADA